ncbi:MAG: sugar-binding domain-containing protein, partial [Candidatus Heimdallarchaeota archaeon]
MNTLSLNGKWKCKPDTDNLGIKQKWYNFENYDISDETLIDIDIPRSFNLIDGFELFEGIFWHFHQFNLLEDLNTMNFDYILRFKGSNYNTKVWINGSFVGTHDGGFTPFEIDVTKFIKLINNFLVVRSENTRKKTRIPSLSFDWFNWGGIYRKVDLLILNKKRIKDLIIKTCLIKKNRCKIEIFYKTIGAPSIRWEIREVLRHKLFFEGLIFEENTNKKIEIIFNNPKLWSPNTPHLYTLKLFRNDLKISNDLLYETTFGIRQIEVYGTS